jgi:hypothetical protein
MLQLWQKAEDLNSIQSGVDNTTIHFCSTDEIGIIEVSFALNFQIYPA